MKNVEKGNGEKKVANSDIRLYIFYQCIYVE